MAITALEFGKTLRPTTVELVTKLNETIAAVNTLNPTAVTQLSKDVEALKTTANDLNTKVTTNTTDIDKMKVTLYTPLANPDTDPSNPAKEI
nr:MAG TPA: hypothetical protein [Bacteriophage sp.]